MQDYIKQAKQVLNIEAQAILDQLEQLDDQFIQACETILPCKGRVVVLGMGKSGHIGGKIAATLASTGTPAFFVHPGEANHGDLGMITQQDVVLALSNSGETDELLTLLPTIEKLAVPLIAITSNATSTLANKASTVLLTNINKEACPLDLAPTASTTVALALGDALAVALLSARSFTADDFARSHPGGRLGKRLILTVDDIMHTGAAIPKVTEQTSIKDALLEISEKRLGMTTIVKNNNQLAGVFTDGDLRRCLDNNINIHEQMITEMMTTQPATIRTGTLAIHAMELMEQKQINAIVVLDEQNTICGALNMHDILKSGIV